MTIELPTLTEDQLAEDFGHHSEIYQESVAHSCYGYIQLGDISEPNAD